MAENGALLYRPATREEKLLAPPPSEEFVALLRSAASAPLSTGRVIVAGWEPHETTILQAIRDLGLELQVIFNKGAVMVLPSGINKATGLAAALHELGLSCHNTVAVGDAENDHALLASCEAGVAVANALPTLKEHADWVTIGSHGAGVQELIDRLVGNDLAELDPKLSRHDILLGQDSAGNPYRLHPFRGNLLIAGSSGGGKSTVSTAIIEQLVHHAYQVCIIDPEGDYEGLENVLTVGAAHQAPNLDAILKLLDSPNQSVSINLLGLAFQDRPSFFHSLAARLHDFAPAPAARIGSSSTKHITSGRPCGNPAALTAPHELDRTIFITLDPHLLPPQALKTVELVLAVGQQPQQILNSFAATVGIAMPSDGAPQAPLEQGMAVAWKVDSSIAAASHQSHSRPLATPPPRAQIRRGGIGTQSQFLFPRSRRKTKSPRTKPDGLPPNGRRGRR